MTLSRLTSTVTDLQLTARVKRRSAGADDFRRKNMSRFFSTSRLYWVPLPLQWTMVVAWGARPGISIMFKTQVLGSWDLA